ncbi:MAG: hypothetical protein PHE02_02740 [Lachnospiraceae bacterium]|nr:hypothetical protein [Lachnospiraceae bacterium]
MRNDMNRVLIETTIRRTLKEMGDSPERGIRNLIDLGLNFSKGRFQQNFLSMAQQMLRKEDSAYYTLFRDILTHVDAEIMTTFGINVGYNSCTKGAKTIRAIEIERGFCVPWALSIHINKEQDLTRPEFYPNLLRQGKELGIFTYVLFTDGEPAKVIDLMKGQPDCAFLLLLDGKQITPEFITELQLVKNVMIAVSTGKSYLPACRRLRAAKQLYAAYTLYMERDKEEILCGAWLSDAIKGRPAFSFLLADRSCPELMQKEIYDYVLAVRTGQEQPVFLIDIKYDMLHIDEIISDSVCMAGFGQMGRLLTEEGVREEEELNIFHNSLESILNRQRPREK